jgi:hypothetical protein
VSQCQVFPSPHDSKRRSAPRISSRSAVPGPTRLAALFLGSAGPGRRRDLREIPIRHRCRGVAELGCDRRQRLRLVRERCCERVLAGGCDPSRNVAAAEQAGDIYPVCLGSRWSTAVDRAAAMVPAAPVAATFGQPSDDVVIELASGASVEPRFGPAIVTR